MKDLKGYCRTPLGPVEVTVAGQSVVSVRFTSGKKRRSFSVQSTVLKRRLKEISDYFTGRSLQLAAPPIARGTTFEKRVWREIAGIPAASTISYKELARRAGRPRAIRAAATACAKNPLPIFIPCHRVVASGAGLGGYAYGLRRKRWLLAHEASYAL